MKSDGSRRRTKCSLSIDPAHDRMQRLHPRCDTGIKAIEAPNEMPVRRFVCSWDTFVAPTTLTAKYSPKQSPHSCQKEQTKTFISAHLWAEDREGSVNVANLAP